MTRWFKPWPSYPPNVGLVTELSSQRVTQLNHPKKVTFAELPGTHQHEFQLAHHFWGMVWIPSCFGTLGGVHLPGYKETSSSSTKFPQPNGYPFPPETPTPPNPIASSSFFNQKPKKEKKKHAFVVFFSVLDLAFRPKSPMLFTGPKSDPKNPKKNNGTEAVCGGALWWAWTKWTKSHSQPGFFSLLMCLLGAALKKNSKISRCRSRRKSEKNSRPDTFCQFVRNQTS